MTLHCMIYICIYIYINTNGTARISINLPRFDVGLTQQRYYDVIEELRGGFQLSEFADLWEGASTASAITCGQLKIFERQKSM